MEYINHQTDVLPPPHPIFNIVGAQTILSYAQTQCSFVSHTHIYNPSSPLLFAVIIFLRKKAKKASEIVVPPKEMQ